MSRFALVGPIHPLRGGIAQHSAGIVAAARARGHDVHVFSYRRQYPKLLFPGRTQLDPDAPPPEVAGLTTAPIDSLRPSTWWETGGAIRDRHPDVVLLQRWHPFFAPALATIAGRVRGASRVAWMVHNARPHEDRVPWGRLRTLGYRGEDVCFVHAAAEEEALRALGVGCEVRRLAMPAPATVAVADEARARRRLGVEEDEVVFLFFGHVRAYKGVDVLVDALSRLEPAGPRWRAIIAGEWYVDRSSVDEALARAGLGARVHVDDRFVPLAEVGDYFAVATAVVLPYRSGTQSAVVPLAYAYGRPVVTTRVGGLPEAVLEGETGLIVPPDDAASLASALESIRAGRRFAAEALALARARTAHSSVALVEALEAIVRAPVFS